MKSPLAFIRNLPNEFIKVWMPPIFPEEVERTHLTRVLNAVLLLVIVAIAIQLLAIATITVEKSTRQILQLCPNVAVILFSDFDELGLVRAGMDAGALCSVRKGDAMAELTHAIIQFVQSD